MKMYTTKMNPVIWHEKGAVLLSELISLGWVSPEIQPKKCISWMKSTTNIVWKWVKDAIFFDVDIFFINCSKRIKIQKQCNRGFIKPVL